MLKLRNNRSLEDLRALKKLKEKNMSHLQLSKFEFFLQRPVKTLELMGHTLLHAEVRPQGIFACSDLKKDQMSYIPLSDIRVAIESKPKDPNRFKAINPQILEWS